MDGGRIAVLGVCDEWGVWLFCLEDASGGAGGADGDGDAGVAAGAVAGVGGAHAVAVDRSIDAAAFEIDREVGGFTFFDC